MTARVLEKTDLLNPGLLPLVGRALLAHGFEEGALSLAQALEYLFRESMLWVVYWQGEQPLAICAASLPEGPLDKNTVQVTLFYSEAPGVRRRLAQALVDTLKERGYNKFWALNNSGATDEVWARAFSPEGWYKKPLGCVYAFSVEENEDENG